MEDGLEEIKMHKFFSGIDWEALEDLDVKVPFKPKVEHSADVSQIDNTFTSASDVYSESGKSTFIQYDSYEESEVALFYKEDFHIPNFTFVNKEAIDKMLQK